MSKPKALSMLKKLGMGQLLGPKSKRPSLWFITFIHHIGFCKEMSKRKEQFSPNLFCVHNCCGGKSSWTWALHMGHGLFTLNLSFWHGGWAFKSLSVGSSHPAQAFEGLCTSMFSLHKVSMTRGYICMDNQTQGPLANW